MYSEDELLPISCLQHLIFCERRAMLVLLEDIWGDNRFTMEGQIIHEKVHKAETESRGDVHTVRGLRLRSLRLGLVGKTDVVEFHRLDTEDKFEGVSLDGLRGSWRPYLVEYKRGYLRDEKGYKIQLCAQAMCLEEMIGESISAAGAIFFGKTRRRLQVIFDAPLRAETEETALRLHELTKAGKTPQAEYGKKCESCSLLDRCMPKLAGRRMRVEKYLTSAIMGIVDRGENL